MNIEQQSRYSARLAPAASFLTGLGGAVVGGRALPSFLFITSFVFCSVPRVQCTRCRAQP